MIVDIKRNGKYYYVEGNDCYILYYLFRLNNIYINDDINYTKYLDLGKSKYLFDRDLLSIENKLNNITDSKSFNKTYRKIINKLYE